MKFKFNDGGRAAAGFKGDTGDCVVRAIAIATDSPYDLIYAAINTASASERRTKLRKKRSSARTGVHKATWKRFIEGIGGVWTPTMGIGTGCKVHLKADELPSGRLIVSVSKHLVAVIDGVVYDTHDPCRDGTRCVYGYYSFPNGWNLSGGLDRIHQQAAGLATEEIRQQAGPRIVARAKADDNHEVITVTHKSETNRYRRQPCEECPWRKDSPRGAFPAEAYRISAKTDYDMAQTTFACHMAGKDKPTTCAGFLLKGSAHNLQVRMALSTGKLDLHKVESDVPLFSSYRAMAVANGVAPNDPVLIPCRGDEP